MCQVISPISTLQYNVDNNAFSVKVSWVAIVNKTIGNDTFNVTAEIAAISVGYVKSYNTDKKKFEITNVSYKFTNDIIV
jgi:hypothetical protein